jgi:hypothetical protein
MLWPCYIGEANSSCRIDTIIFLSLSEFSVEASDEEAVAEKIIRRQQKFIKQLNTECHLLLEDNNAKAKKISDLERKFNVQREKVRDAAMIKVRVAYTQ